MKRAVNAFVSFRGGRVVLRQRRKAGELDLPKVFIRATQKSALSLCCSPRQGFSPL